MTLFVIKNEAHFDFKLCRSGKKEVLDRTRQV